MPYAHLPDVLEQSAAQYPQNRLFGTKKDGRWQWINYRDFDRRVSDFRGGLARLGVTAGDTVAVIASNRVEWALAAYAAYGLAARFCPMYEHQREEDWDYIIRDSGAKVLLVATYEIYEKVRDWASKIDALEHIFCMSLPAEDEASFLWLEESGRTHPTKIAEIDEETVCGFIYTSGTTGKPKGVLLSHGNICSNLNAVREIFPLRSDDISVSFLPWAHSFGQTTELHCLLAGGGAIAIAESIEKLGDNLVEVKPTILFAVPRIFNKIYDGLLKRLAEEGGVKKVLFEAGMANAEVRKRLAEEGRSSTLTNLKHAFFDKFVFVKVRARFGGRLRFAISGGAALSPEVADFIDKLGIFVCEGYGLTETSPIVTGNYPGSRKIGSVGRPIPHVEVIIDQSVVEDDRGDGEIVVKGPNVMKGYHGLPEETAAVITADGSFRTGDLGRLDEDGFLWITGRIKEQYKLENGKYVVPAPLEDLLQLSPYIMQAFVYGANKLFNIALLVPDRASLEKWAKNEGISASYEELCEHEKTRALIKAQLEKYGDGFKGYEKIRNFCLIPEEFSVDNGMLTPKMSLKRRIVMDRYEKQIDALYA